MRGAAAGAGAPRHCARAVLRDVQEQDAVKTQRTHSSRDVHAVHLHDTRLHSLLPTLLYNKELGR